MDFCRQATALAQFRIRIEGVQRIAPVRRTWLVGFLHAEHREAEDFIEQARRVVGASRVQLGRRADKYFALGMLVAMQNRIGDNFGAYTGGGKAGSLSM